MKGLIIYIILFILATNLNAQIKVEDEKDRREMGNIELLTSYMQGTFSSEEQSKQDTTYFHIILHMKRMWTERTDGIWLYVEQAIAGSDAKPYRQRVYKLTELQDGTIESAVYTIQDALKYAGEWKSDSPLEGLDLTKLTQRKNCSVYLTRNEDESYSGSTKGKDCESELRNAKYATSDVTINSERMISWDRGYDENGKQVWGAVKGGYIFNKVSN